MKKSGFVFVLIMVFVPLMKSQEKGVTRVSLVIEPVVSWIKSDHKYISTEGSLPGYNFGFKIDRFFGDNYAFTTGISINTVGGKLGYPAVEQTHRYVQTYRLKYLEIPAGLRLRSDDLRRINIYGRFGLSPQINIKATDNKGEGITDKVRLFEMGYHLGGGIEYSLGGRNGLMFGLIFNNGFTDVTKKNIEDKAILNRLTFEFGFIF